MRAGPRRAVMSYKRALFLIFASAFFFAEPSPIHGREAATSKSGQGKPSPSPTYLITKNSAGSVRLGMTVAQVRKALPKLKLARTMDGDGVALIEAKRGDSTEMLLYAGEENPESPINERAKVEVIKVFGKAYRTPEGVHPGMPLKDAEKSYGKVRKIEISEIEWREYAKFTRHPEGLQFQIGLPDMGRVGKYPEGKLETTVYSPSAVVTNIDVYGN
jgi:hypothetical protein